MKIRKAVLLLACAVSWGIAVWFAGRLWAAYPLVSVRSDVPVTGRQLEALRSALRQEDGASALVPAFWSQAEGSAESRWETCGITAILYCGEYDAVYPAVLLEGRFPAAQENGKCAVSTAAAWQLWGSEDVLGQELEIEGDIYRVCGLFRSSASLALCGESLDHGFSNIEFWGGYAAPPVETVQQLLRAAGIAQQVTLYFPFPWMAALTAYALCPAGLVLLAAALLCTPAQNALGRRRTGWLGAFAAVYAVGAMTAMYITYTPVGMVRIVGLQTRYFLPVWLLLIVGVAALARRALKPALTAERGEALALPLCGWYAFAGAVLLFQHYFIGPVYVIYQ